MFNVTVLFTEATTDTQPQQTPEVDKRTKGHLKLTQDNGSEENSTYDC